MKKNVESVTYTLSGDLEGMTVENLREMLDEYPDNARIVVRSEPEYGYGGWTNNFKEHFVFTWEEEPN